MPLIGYVVDHTAHGRYEVWRLHSRTGEKQLCLGVCRSWESASLAARKQYQKSKNAVDIEQLYDR